VTSVKNKKIQKIQNKFKNSKKKTKIDT